MAKKKTYGEQLIEHEALNLGPEDDVREYRKLIERDLVKQMYQVVEETVNLDTFKDKDFYIVNIIKIEKIGQVPRFYTFARHSCPTPHYRMSCFKYNHVFQTLDYLFALPDEDYARAILKHLPAYLARKDTEDMAKFVHLHETGELLNWVKKENGEKKDGPQAIITIEETAC